MRDTRKPNSAAPILSFEEAVAPLLESGMSFSAQRKLLLKMYTISVCNAPDDELENFTAKELSPFLLALCETLENLDCLTRETSI